MFFNFTGSGLFATSAFLKNEFIAEYVGEVIDEEEADKREIAYEKNCEGNFLYYFKTRGERKW